jgi:Mrp family chromosome partitioning ATPase
MILSIHSDASYHSETKACSRDAGHFILTESLQHPTVAPKPADTLPAHNGAILIINSILPMVVASATEAELAALYYNA